MKPTKIDEPCPDDCGGKMVISTYGYWCDKCGAGHRCTESFAVQDLVAAAKHICELWENNDLAVIDEEIRPIDRLRKALEAMGEK